MAVSGFWDKQDQAREIIAKANRLKSWVDPWNELDGKASDLVELGALLETESDDALEAEWLAEVEEVANLVVMLASPLMHMVNGTMIEIDGGQDKPLMDRFRDKPRG